EYEATDPGPDDELRCEYLADGELDAGAWARDQVVFAHPDLILCRPDCAGLCPTCGKDLNAEPHEHPGEAIDGRWAALEALGADMPPAGGGRRRGPGGRTSRPGADAADRAPPGSALPGAAAHGRPEAQDLAVPPR